MSGKFLRHHEVCAGCGKTVSRRLHPKRLRRHEARRAAGVPIYCGKACAEAAGNIPSGAPA